MDILTILYPLTDMEFGHMDDRILKTNLKKAIDVYFSHVNNCPCGDTVIQLFKGEDVNHVISLNTDRIYKPFLKGSK